MFPLAMMGVSQTTAPPVITGWEQVAPQLNSQSDIYSLCVHAGALYGSTTAGRLFLWNGSNAWSQVAGSYSGTTAIRKLLSFGGALYGCDDSGRLLLWDAVSAWTLVGQPVAGIAYDMVEFGGTIFMAVSGSLQRWNGGASFTQISINPGTGVVKGLIDFSSLIFGGGGGSGIYIVSSTGSASWVNQETGFFGDIQVVQDLENFGGALFACSSGAGGGVLWRWNGANDLELISGPIATEQATALISYKGLLLVATAGKLRQWDGASTLTVVATTLDSQGTINCLIEYDDALYAGTTNGGRLFRAVQA